MRSTSRIAFILSFALLSHSSIVTSAEVARQTLPPGAKVVGLDVHPKKIDLTEKFAYRQLLATAELANGEVVDVTRLAAISAPEKLAAVSPEGIVSARTDGAGSVEVAFGGISIGVPFAISNQGQEFKPSFVKDIQPVMSRLGCNQGTCHGSQAGKNGFKLSLRGNDYSYDHRALIDDLEGRRFNRAAPDRSLFLMKVSGAVPHVGGVLTKPGETYYEKFRAWVADGVELDLDSPRVDKIEIFPKNRVVPLPGMTQKMSVIATYTDGATRDVTTEAFVETSNTEVTKVATDGTVTTLRRGEAAIMARYEGRYAATQLFVMGDRSGWAWKEVPTYNYIDEHVYTKLKKIKSLPSGTCTDAEFIRRIYLDLIGIPPAKRDVMSFLADRRDSKIKRAELVDRLIGSSEFVEFWTNKWADLLQVNKKWLGVQGASALRDWLSGAIASNMPYNDFVYQILNSTGSTIKNPPTSYYKVLRSPEATMENTTQLFLGVRFNCNKCHDHPFERWTQKNYWELSAYFAQIERKAAPGSKSLPKAGFANTGASEELISDRKNGDVKLPNGLVAAPSFPYPHGGGEVKAETRRGALAGWLTAPENPYFARSYVNRLWSYFLGVGLIDPVDDIRAGNPPSNPELLEKLTNDFVASGFEVRKLMRLIVNSRTYQHSIDTNKWNENDSINFSHALARRLTAETLYDAIHRAAGSVSRLPGQRPGTRAVELPGPDVKTTDGFLDLFGRPPRESACECERTSGMSLGQALNLVNGPTFANAINDANNEITSLVSFERDANKIVDELFVSFLSRMPVDAERKALASALDPRNPANVEALDPSEYKQFIERLDKWAGSQPVAEWTPLKPTVARSANGAVLAVQEDGSVLASGKVPDTDTYVVIAWTPMHKLTGVRLEARTHDSLGAFKRGPGRTKDNGNFVLSEMTVHAIPVDKPGSPGKKIPFHNPSHTFAQKDLGSNFVIDGKTDDKKGWAIHPRGGQTHHAVFETKEDIGGMGGTLLVFTLDQHHGGQHVLGHFRISVTDSKRPVRVQTLPDGIVKAIMTPKEKRTPAQHAELVRHYLNLDKETQEQIRLRAAQDIAWALANSPAFLFNR